MECLLEYDGAMYVPVKVLPDPDGKCISAGWLSTQVKHLQLQQMKASQLGLTTGSGEGG